MNFALLMLVLLVVTGGVWLLDRFYLRRRRPADAKEPWWIEYSKSFFPVILAVFLLRSFLVEPFKIPSGSMIPTLLVGDFILVNKYTYGIRLPVANVKVLAVNEPKRGEVMVFRYPENPSLDYIKRVVGVPGDRVSYINKQLSINGQAVPMTPVSDHPYAEAGLNFTPAKEYREDLDGHMHAVLINPEMPTVQLVHRAPVSASGGL